MTYPRYGPGFPAPPPAAPSYAQYFVPQPMPAWAPPSAPARPASLPWLIGGLVALLVAGGIGLVFLLQDDATGLVADPPMQSDPGTGNGPVADPRPVPSPPTDCLVECTDADAPSGSDPPDTEAANYTGSDDAAVGFVEAIANGDVVGAHEALCGAGKNRFPTPEDLVADFYATFGFTTITGARLTDIYAADSSADAVVFELETDAGDVVVEVYIVEEGSSLMVCGYDVP